MMYIHVIIMYAIHNKTTDKNVVEIDLIIESTIYKPMCQVEDTDLDSAHYLVENINGLPF